MTNKATMKDKIIKTLETIWAYGLIATIILNAFFLTNKSIWLKFMAPIWFGGGVLVDIIYVFISLFIKSIKDIWKSEISK